jgi:hypothetical protein
VTSGTKGLEIESTKAQKHPHEFLHATNRAKFPWLDKVVTLSIRKCHLNNNYYIFVIELLFFLMA